MTDVTAQRILDLENALRLATNKLAASEPNDARGFSDEFVAMSAVCEGLTNDEHRKIIRKASKRHEQPPEL